MPKTTDEILAGFEATAKTSLKGAYRHRVREGHVDLHPGNVEGSTVRLIMSTTHDKDDKEYRTTVHLTQIMPSEGPFAISKWEPMNRRHNLRLPGIPVARYSAKTHAAAYENALAILKEDPALLTENLDLGVTSIA